MMIRGTRIRGVARHRIELNFYYLGILKILYQFKNRLKMMAIFVLFAVNILMYISQCHSAPSPSLAIQNHEAKNDELFISLIKQKMEANKLVSFILIN